MRVPTAARGFMHAHRKDTVVVQIEAHVGRFPDVHFPSLIAREGVFSEWPESGAVAFQRLGDRMPSVFRPRSLERERRRPLVCLAIDILEARERPSGDEVVADVAYGSLNAPLLIASVRCDRPRFVAVVSCECQKLLVEADRIADAIEDHAREIIVKNRARHAAPVRERFLVPGEKVRELLAGKEPQEDRS